MTTRRPLAVAAMAMAAAIGVSSAADAQVTARQASRQFAESYGVQVLKVRSAEIDGKRVYLLTVMNPKGDFNEAFQVNTVAVDADTGNLIAGFRHRSSGYDANQAPSFRPNLNSADTLSWGFVWR
jgi:hypothetical protein